MGNIFLVGMPGAGKTTIGRTLAKRLNMTFADSDKELMARTGVSIATIFEIEGEAGFRVRESVTLAELVQRDGLVLATGGGTVLAPVNRRLLKENATVIYLRATLEDLWQRTRRDVDRPLLQTEDPRATLETLLQTRDPLYREVAHLIIDTGTQSVARLTTDILARLDQHRVAG
jgi:shikimate kinase